MTKQGYHPSYLESKDAGTANLFSSAFDVANMWSASSHMHKAGLSEAVMLISATICKMTGNMAASTNQPTPKCF